MVLGLYFDAPVSARPTGSHVKPPNPAFDQYHPLPLPKPKPEKAPSLLRNLSRKAFGASGGPRSLAAAHGAKAGPPTPAKESQLFRLPLAVREKIYGYLVGRHELLHILLRYRSKPSRWEVAYRRCGAGGNVDDCVLKNCREFHDTLRGSYYGYFDNVGGLFRTCRDIYEEASHVLYTQNILEFDHPLSLITFSGKVSPSSLQSIRSISIDLQRYIYVYGSDNFGHCTSLHPDQWLQMWHIISTMQGLEEIRVRFQLLIDGWMGWSEKEILKPLYWVTRPLKVFEVEMISLPGDISSNSNDDDDTDAPFKLIKYGPSTSSSVPPKSP